MKSFILAGGFATRLWPLTERRAKPLLPLAGEPLLTHLLRRIPADVSVTVSTNAIFARDMQQWASTIKDRAILEILVEDSGHDDSKLGALGAVAKWITDRQIQEDVLLLAGDNFLELDLARFIACGRGNPLLAACDIGSLESAKAFGTVILSEEANTSGCRTVTAFEEKPEKPRSTFVSTGCSLLPASSLPVLVEYAHEKPDNIGGIFEEFLRRKMPVDCFLFSERWRDIGSFDSYMALHCDVLKGKQIIDPTASVDSSSILRGSIDIGPKSVIRGSTLTDCIVFGAATIDNCVIDHCILDEKCELTGVDLTGKMLRAATVLKR